MFTQSKDTKIPQNTSILFTRSSLTHGPAFCVSLKVIFRGKKVTFYQRTILPQVSRAKSVEVRCFQQNGSFWMMQRVYLMECAFDESKKVPQKIMRPGRLVSRVKSYNWTRQVASLAKNVQFLLIDQFAHPAPMAMKEMFIFIFRLNFQCHQSNFTFLYCIYLLPDTLNPFMTRKHLILHLMMISVDH